MVWWRDGGRGLGASPPMLLLFCSPASSRPHARPLITPSRPPSPPSPSARRPHPWGLLITFIELIKNPRYSFWSHAFTRVAPEIERLFESVARSCMGPQVAVAAAGGPPPAAKEDGLPPAAPAMA